jgi:hypothetical protein
VGDRKGFDDEIFIKKLLSALKIIPLERLSKFFINGHCRRPIGEAPDMAVFEKPTQTLGMVHVFMGDENGVNFFDSKVKKLQALQNLLPGKPRID